MVTSKENYEAVLADLRKELKNIDSERDRILILIKGLEERISSSEQASLFTVTTNQRKDEILSYAGMSTYDAAVSFLRKIGVPTTTGSIVRALIKGGLETDAADKPHSVKNSLYSAAKRKNSEIVRDGKLWGLKEWEKGSA